MRLKTYTAPNMSDAMRLVRRELGDDAIIVSSRRLPDGATKITAALEEDLKFEAEINEVITGERLSVALKRIQALLNSHSTLPHVTEAIVNISHSLSGEHPEKANDIAFLCGRALNRIFKFTPLPTISSMKAIMLLGPPGGGKTITTAKLAARACLDNRPVSVISTDHMRAGAIEQLTAFTKILNLDLQKALTPEDLSMEIRKAREKNGSELIFIDTPGLNPFNPHDMEFLASLILAGNIEPVLVIGAGGDAAETADIADIFAETGAKKLITTRLDMTQKIGPILSAAYKSRLELSEVSITPSVAKGLCPLSADALTKLIIPEEYARMEAQKNAHSETKGPQTQRRNATNNDDEIDFSIRSKAGGII